MRHARTCACALGISLGLIPAGGCGLDLEPPDPVIHARFDPDAKVIPMPNDVLRDDAGGHLDIPIDDDLTAAEALLYRRMNELDGWSSAMSATVEFDGAIDPSTISADTVQVWHWRETPTRIDDVTITVAADDRSLTIDPPRTGWARGGRYGVVLRGGAAGIEGKAGERVECDAAFYFLRQTERLDTAAHERAFPGNTAAERQDNAAKLEEIRVDLAPRFDFFAAAGVPRAEVAALWDFRVTERVELAMDKASQRMPLPLDLLRDPDTGAIDLPIAAWDSPTVIDAKQRLRAYDGFALSANLMFQLTGPVDPATVGADTVELWQLSEGAAPVRVPAEVTLLADGQSIEVAPSIAPLPEKTRFGVIVSGGIRAADGTPIALMPLGHLLQGDAEVAIAGQSQIDSVADDDARRVERMRPDVVAFRAALGDRARGALAAWTYTTMTAAPAMAGHVDSAAALSVPMTPAALRRQTPLEALAEFVLGIGSIAAVGEVVHGTIPSPVFLDPLTRALRGDGGHEVQDLAFTATIPRRLPPAGQPLPVVIFGHAIMTERRFVLAIGDALARRGFAAVAIDLPLHGTRACCWRGGPLSVPDPTTGELTPLTEPCPSGTTCQEDGRCVAPDGRVEPMKNWPVITMPTSSGAAFIEIEKIANTRDHVIQSVIDLAALHRSLREGDWTAVFGRPVDTTRIQYAGQSLGGVIGATFVALSTGIDRAVLNVAGADTVDLFDASPFFGGQVDAFFTREGVDRDSFDGHRFLNVARWIMDTADPATFAAQLVRRPTGPPRGVLLQMALGDTIIPNEYTRTLEALSGAPRIDYLAEHAFLAIPIEPEYARGSTDLAKFLAEEIDP
jgi:hypothetical protein